MSELFTNNAAGRLASGISAGSTTLTLKAGEGAAFPEPSGGDFFRLTLVKLATSEYEIAYCTARSGDSLTLSRASEDGTNHPALALAINDLAQLRPTAGFFNSLDVTTHAVRDNAMSYASASGTPNTYQVSLTPAPAGYVAGMSVRFKAGFTNTAAVSVSVNGLGTIALKKHFDQALAAGDIQQGQLVEALYDGTNFQWLNAYRAPKLGRVLVDIQPSYGSVYSVADNSTKTVTFNRVLYDTATSWSAGSPTRITVPSGVSVVRLSARVQLIVSGTLGANEHVKLNILQNGNLWEEISNQSTSVYLTNRVFAGDEESIELYRPPMIVTPGDYFELEVHYVGSAATVQFWGQDPDAYTANGPSGTWFSMEVVE